MGFTCGKQFMCIYIYIYIYPTALRATPPPCLELYVVIALWLGCVSCVWCYDVVVWWYSVVRFVALIVASMGGHFGVLWESFWWPWAPFWWPWAPFWWPWAPQGTPEGPSEINGRIFGEISEFWDLLRVPILAHFLQKNVNKIKKNEKVDTMKKVPQKSWNGTPQTLENRCFTIVKHGFPWLPPTHLK